MRQQAETVDLAFVGGVGKARQFLRLARNVSARAKQIGLLCYKFAHNGDWERANRFRKAYDRMSDLHSELREKARHAIRQPSTLSYEAAPTPTPYNQLKEAIQ